jgi:hypothetical protein
MSTVIRWLVRRSSDTALVCLNTAAAGSASQRPKKHRRGRKAFELHRNTAARSIDALCAKNRP